MWPSCFSVASSFAVSMPSATTDADQIGTQFENVAKARESRPASSIASRMQKAHASATLRRALSSRVGPSPHKPQPCGGAIPHMRRIVYLYLMKLM